MEQLTRRILQRSSDAVVIVRLSDATIVGVNDAFSAVTGHPQRDLVGQPSRALLVGLGPTGGPTSAGALAEVRSVTDAPTGLWSGSGELRAGSLSALVVELDGQHHAVCAIREVREPTLAERCLAAREELNRILRSGGPWPLAAAGAVERFGRCLQWEFGAIWAADPGSQRLRCVAVWNAAPDLEALEQTSRRAAFAPGEGLLGRMWLSREPAWPADAWADPEIRRSRGTWGPIHGWLGFPARGSGGVVGVVEFISREPRPPSKELLQMIEEFGRLFGRLIEEVRAERAGPAAESGPGLPATREAPPRTVSDAIQDLVGAVAAMTEALERHPIPASQEEPPGLLGELAVEVGELNRLLEGARDPNADDSPTGEPRRASDSIPAELPRMALTGLTLKAVSLRTGIPAATLRTWERRYGFIRPLRSPSGYRLYSEEEIARIQQVKYLLDQGVRIGAAMEAVTRAAGQTRPQPDEDDA
jgi:hypothetical protein